MAGLQTKQLLLKQGYSIEKNKIRIFKKGRCYIVECGETPKNIPRIKSDGGFWDFELAWHYFCKRIRKFK